MKVDDATEPPDRGARPIPDPNRDRAPALRSRSRTCSRRSRPATRAGPCRSTRRAARRRRGAERARPIGDTDPGYDRVEAGARVGHRRLSTSASGAVLRMRFVDELTQQEIGRRLGVSQMQISRISRAGAVEAARGGARRGRGAARCPRHRSRAGPGRRPGRPGRAAGGPSGRRAAGERRHGLVARVEQAHGLVDPGELEEPADVGVRAADAKPSIILGQPALCLDQQAERRSSR